MLKKILVLGMLLVLFAGPGRAADLAKVGYVDMDRVFDEYTEAQKAIQELNKEVIARQNEITKLENEIIALRDELVSQEALLSKEEKLKRAKEIDQKISNLNKYKRDIVEDLARKEEAMTKKLIPAIYNVVQEIGRREGYTLILREDSILYGGEGMDLTDEVIKVLNKGEVIVKERK